MSLLDKKPCSKHQEYYTVVHPPFWLMYCEPQSEHAGGVRSNNILDVKHTLNPKHGSW